MVAFLEDWETGANGATCTTGNTGFSQVSGFTFSTTQFYKGAKSGRFNTTAATATFTIDSGVANTSDYFEAFVWLDALPVADTAIISATDALSGRIADIQVRTDGTLKARDFNNSIGTTTSVVTPGQWFRVEWFVQPTAGAGSTQTMWLYTNVTATTPAAGDTVTGTCSNAGKTDIQHFRGGVTIAATLAGYFDYCQRNPTKIGPVGATGAVTVTAPSVTIGFSMPAAETAFATTIKPASTTLHFDISNATKAVVGSHTTVFADSITIQMRTPNPTLKTGGAGMPTHQLVLECAFTTPPFSTSPVWVDLTSRLDLAAGWAFTRGRGSRFDSSAAGSGSVTLDNHDGALTVGNTASPWASWLVPGRRMRLRDLVTPPGGSAFYAPIFDGFVAAWPTANPTGTNYAEAQITLVDGLQRLSVSKALSGHVQEEIKALGAVAYWPLGEAATATAFQSLASRPQPALVAANTGAGVGTLTPGSTWGPGTTTALALTQTSSSNGKYLTATTNVETGRYARNWSVHLGFTVPVGATAQTLMIVPIIVGQSVIEINGSGRVQVRMVEAVASTTVAGATTVTDGRSHSLVLTVSGTAFSLYLDGALENSGTWAFPTDRATAGAVSLGGGTGNLFAGTLAHPALFSTALPTDAALYLSRSATGFAGDTAGLRASKLASYVGIPTTAQSIGTTSSTVGAQTLEGASALAALQEVAAAEAGFVSWGRTGLLEFHGRVEGYNQAPVVFASTVLDSLPNFVSDLMELANAGNDVTVQLPDRSEQRAVNQDSIDGTPTTPGMGLYQQTITVPLADATQALLLAQFRVQTFGIPRPRPDGPVVVDLPTCGDPATPALALGVDLGTDIQVTGLNPTYASGATLSADVIGVTARGGLGQLSLEWAVATNVTGAVLKLDDPVYGALDHFPIAF